MNPFLKIALLLLPTLLLLAVVLAGPSIGLGIKEQFVLYRWLGISRSESLPFIALAAAITLLYPTASIIASSFSAEPAGDVKSHSLQQKTNYRPDIDGLRAVAVVAVIINHFGGAVLPGGYLGVDVFFVISGFVILSSMVSHGGKSVLGSLLDFYARRVRRIVPALVLFVLICSLAICLVAPDPSFSLVTGIASLFGLSNVYLLSHSMNYFAESAQYNTFTHTWSLGVEEQFYLIVPLIVYTCLFYRGRDKGRRLLLAIMIALTAASAIYCVKLFQTDPSAAFFLMPARFWEIGLGCISYLLVSSGADSNAFYRRQPVVLLLALCGALFAPAWLYLPAIFFIVAVTAILIATPAPESAAYKILTLRPILFIGRISYSLYLWHWGVLSVSRWFIGDSVWSAPVQLICILLMSLLSYYCVEAPLRRFQWNKHAWKGIVAGAYACIFAALLLAILAVPLRPQLTAVANRINPLKFAPQPINQKFLSCHLPKDTNDPIEKCLLPVDRSKHIIYLIGDSHASNYVGSIELAARKFPDLEFRYLVEWGFIGSFSDVPKCKDNPNRPCIDDSFDKHMEFFGKNIKPGDLVIFSWARDSVVYEGTIPRKPNYSALKILRDKLIEMRSVVISRGAHLILVDDIPKPCNDEVHWSIIYSTGRYEICSTTVAASREDRRPLTDLYESLVSDKVHYFDLHDSLCSQGVCGIYDRQSKSLIYSENSPHFPPSRASPLVDEWISFFSHLLPSLRAAKTE